MKCGVSNRSIKQQHAQPKRQTLAIETVVHVMTDLARLTETLEEEIHALRVQMERLVNEEQSFSSEVVVEMSGKLDRKINEYMRLSQESR
jgi:hypothetical protein